MIQRFVVAAKFGTNWKFAVDPDADTWGKWGDAYLFEELAVAEDVVEQLAEEGVVLVGPGSYTIADTKILHLNVGEPVL